MKKRLYAFLSLIMVACLLLTSCNENGCPHVFENACDDDCEICDYERTVCHVWEETNCYKGSNCINCGEHGEDALGHNVVFERGIDSDPKVCDRCHFFVYPDNHTEPYHD